MTEKVVAYRRKSALQRQHELVLAGIECLGNGGMAAFTIDRICKQAGVSRGLINHHFHGKEGLLTRIYVEMTEHLVQEQVRNTPQQHLAAIVDNSFDKNSFNKSNLRAWLSIWGQVPTNVVLRSLHQQRYQIYQARIETALADIANQQNLQIDSDSISRQLIALIDGLWLEYCLHSEGFSLATARSDCYHFLQCHGINI